MKADSRTPEKAPDPLLFGHNPTPGLVAVEWAETDAGADEVVLFIREGGRTREEREAFEPFLVVEGGRLKNCPVPFRSRPLAGGAALRLNEMAVFPNWKECQRARTWLGKESGRPATDPGAPYLFLNDPVHQYLILSGRTHFIGMEFEQVRRMQVDIECATEEGYEFCNPEREADRIIAIGLSDQTGWVEALDGSAMDEKAMLKRFVDLVRERDPDVIEGHNIFNFDLPYIAERARRHGVKLALGRDGTAPARRASRFSVGERTLAYDRFDFYGRHVVDTYFLVQAYDVSHRSLDGFGLKEAAVHFGLAARDRTYIEGSRISSAFKADPAQVMRYVRDDVVETRGLAGLLSRSNFIQAQMLPYSYQNVCVRGTATKIDALMMREYLRQGHAFPVPDQAREFEGGYTDMFAQGVVRNVHHVDVRSLYPSLMLTRKLAPKRDELGVFLRLLEMLRAVRMEARASMQRSATSAERTHFDALQATFKVLINSFYGYLGFSQARFNDYDAAEEVTAQGRALLRSMIAWLREHGATPIEIDTDGIYFVPPGPAPEGAGSAKPASMEKFRREFAATLPEGIEVEFDGEYVAMFSHRMKNYALLSADGEMVVKGAALKSRGLEPFQRDFMQEVIRLKLEGKDAAIPALKAEYERAIRERAWPIERLAKTENLQDSPASYADKRQKDKRSKSAVYELALRSGREYRAGDQISYYVTGAKKNVSVHEAAKMVSEWNPASRDENVAYYLAKLDALGEKFTAPEEGSQGELDLAGDKT